jgi:hypothetical protein
MRYLIPLCLLGFTTSLLAFPGEKSADVVYLKQLVEKSEKGLALAQKKVDLAEKMKGDSDFVKNAVSGHYKMGDLVDVPLKSQQWSPGAWNNALTNTADGASMEYMQATSVFSDGHKLLSQADFIKSGGTQTGYLAYKKHWETVRAASAIAETAYNKLNKDSAQIKTLQQAIESAPNSKAAQDLQNRIGVEEADMQVQEQRIKVVDLKLAAEQKAQALDSEKKEAEFEK